MEEIYTPITEFLEAYHESPRIKSEEVSTLSLKEAKGIPLKDVDRWMTGTYCMVTSKLGKNYIYRFNEEKSLYLFSPTNFIRRKACYIATHISFDMFIMLTVICHCILLAYESGEEYDFDHWFVGIYTFEMVIYSIARGFIIGNFTYLRSPWRCLDFIIVVMGLVTIVLSLFDSKNQYIDELKSLKAFVILKTISIIPGLRLIVNAMLRSLRAMFDVALLTILFIVTISLLGKELFMGVLLQKCVSDKILYNSLNIENKSYWLIDDNDRPVSCGFKIGSRKCPHGFICLKNIGKYSAGYDLNFDDFLSSVFATFRIVTLDDWEEVFKELFYTAGSMSILYIAPLIFFGTFFLLNVMLAIVAMSYQAVLNEDTEESEIKENIQHFRESEYFHFRIDDLDLIKYTENIDDYTTFRRPGFIVDIHDEKTKATLLKERMDSELLIDSELSESIEFEEEISYKSLKLGCWNRLRLRLYYIIHNPMIEIFRFCNIVLGTAVLACEHHGMSKGFEDFLKRTNEILTYIGTVDLVLTMITYGPGFFSDGWRVFDGIIVIFSNVELFLSGLLKLTTLKSLRLIRLMKFSQTLKKTVSVIGNTLLSLAGLSFVLFVIMYVFAVIGTRWLKQEFEYRKKFYLDRWTFLDFFHSLLAIFKISLGEWTESITDCIMITSERRMLCTTLALFCFFIGNFIILNLFIAVLLGAFEVDTFMETEDEETENIKKAVTFLKTKLGFLIFWKKDKKQEGNLPGTVSAPDKKAKKKQKTNLYSICPRPIRNLVEKLHSMTTTIVNSRWFELLSLIIIVVGTIPLCFPYSSLDPDSDFVSVLITSNTFFTILLILETVLRLLATENLLSDGLLMIDFSIIWVCLLSIFTTSIFGIQLVTVRVIRLLRILKSLKHITRWSQMQIIIEAVLQSSRSVFKVLLICLYIWLTFAIIGVQLFSGSFQFCVDKNSKLLLTDVVAVKEDCYSQNFTWIKPKINFDHIGNSYLALLHIAYFESWKEIVESGVDSNGVDKQPNYEANLFGYIYFFIFIIFGSVFSTNLLIGIVIDSFNAMKKQAETKVMADLESPIYYTLYKNMKKILEKEPFNYYLKNPKDITKLNVYQFIGGQWSETLISSLVVLQILVLSTDYYNQPESMTNIHLAFEYVLVIIYSIEAILKLIIFKFEYFSNTINCLDFSLLAISYASLVIRHWYQVEFPKLTTMLVFRVTHFVTMIEHMRDSESMRRLISTITTAIPYLFSIGVIWIVVLLIYAIVGISWFGDVEGSTFDDTFNFRSLSSVMSILFYLLTASGWADILDNLSEEPPNCDENYKHLPYGNCGIYGLAIIYVLSYILVSHIILENMFIAVILDNYNEIMYPKEVVTDIDLDNFYDKWAEYNIEGTHFIPLTSLPEFLETIIDPSPLKSDMEFNLPIYQDDKIHCVDVLVELMKHKARPDDEAALVINQIFQKLHKSFVKKFATLNTPVIDTIKSVREKHNAASIIEKNYRNFQKNIQYKGLKSLTFRPAEGFTKYIFDYPKKNFPNK